MEELPKKNICQKASSIAMLVLHQISDEIFQISISLSPSSLPREGRTPAWNYLEICFIAYSRLYRHPPAAEKNAFSRWWSNKFEITYRRRSTLESRPDRTQEPFLPQLKKSYYLYKHQKFKFIKLHKRDSFRRSFKKTDR